MSVRTSCVFQISIYLVYQVLLGLLHPGILTITLLEVFLSSTIGNLYSECFFLIVCFSLCLQFCNHCYSTCDSYVPQDITHHYGCYNGYQLYGLSGIGSAWCGSATTVDGFCWPHHCAAATPTSVFRYCWASCTQGY